MTSSSVDVSKVPTMVMAYKRTVREAASLPRLERLIVISAVMDHAEDLRHQLIVATPDGDESAEQVAVYVEELRPDDLLQKASRFGGRWASKAAKLGAETVLSEGLWPTLTLVVGAVAAVLGVFHALGEALGAIAAALLLSGAAVLARYPHQVGHMARFTGRAVTATGEAVTDIGRGGSAFVAALTNLGAAAQGVLDRELWPAAGSAAPGVGAGRTTVRTVRNWAQGTAIAVLFVGSVSAVVFGIGVYDGFHRYHRRTVAILHHDISLRTVPLELGTDLAAEIDRPSAEVCQVRREMA